MRQGLGDARGRMPRAEQFREDTGCLRMDLPALHPKLSHVVGKVCAVI